MCGDELVEPADCLVDRFGVGLCSSALDAGAEMLRFDPVSEAFCEFADEYEPCVPVLELDIFLDCFAEQVAFLASVDDPTCIIGEDDGFVECVHGVTQRADLCADAIEFDGLIFFLTSGALGCE